MADLVTSNSNSRGIAIPTHDGSTNAIATANNNNNSFINAADHHHQRIPIWIGSDCKLLSGITRLTTCSQIIQSLIHSSEDPSKHVIVEKWRKMERRLDPNVRILKVWKEWGDQKDDVALILRYHHSSASASSITTACSGTTTNDGYIDKRSCSSNKPLSRRKWSHHHHHGINHGHKQQTTNCGRQATAGTTTTNNSCTLPSKSTCDSHDADEIQMSESMERILNLVLTQGETIQAQLRKLKSQEEQIERYEQHLHRIRSLKDGENYVVDSYLNDERANPSNGRGQSSKRLLFGLSRSRSCNNRQDKKRDKSPRKSNSLAKDRCKKKSEKSQVIDVCTLPEQLNAKPLPSTESTTDDDISMNPTLIEQNELMERICQVNGELTREEERLVKLGLKIKKYQEQINTNSPDDHQLSNDSEDSDEERQISIEETEQRNFISQLSSELEILRRITSEQAHEIEQNEKHLTEIDTLLDEKHDCIVNLTCEIQLLDVESDFLQQRLLQVTTPQHSPSPSQTMQPPPYEQAIAASSLVTNATYPRFQHKPSSTKNSIYYDENNSSFTTSSSIPKSIPAAVVKLAPNSRTKSTTNSPAVISSHLQNDYCQNTICTLSSNNESINCTPTTETTNATELSLQFKSSGACGNGNSRDHQDNDSNSDTGISSLHSSGDENAPFTFDTLV